MWINKKLIKILKKTFVFFAAFSLVISYFYAPLSDVGRPNSLVSKIAQIQPEVLC
ncbi:hypothetical protein KJ853_00425 [Patescibacteria group bacterium]|nr:hypothetical protein [Patescibacteria group bacterium]